MLYKGLDNGFKDVDVPKGIVTGYLAHFGSRDSDGDILVRGAFAKSIKERGPEGSQLIKHLLDHKKDHVIAKFLDLKEDNIGLYYESKVGRHTNGRDFLLMVEDGLINQHSFGFNRIPAREQKKSDGNYMHEVAIKEGSSLQFLGSNPNTPIIGIKSETEVLEYAEKLEKAIRDGSYSDDTILKLIEYSDSIKKSLNENAPADATRSEIAPIDIKQLLNNAFSN